MNQDFLIKEINTFFSCDLLSKSRVQENVRGRSIACKILRKKKYTFFQIAKVLNIHYSTAIHLNGKYVSINEKEDCFFLNNYFKNQNSNDFFLELELKLTNKESEIIKNAIEKIKKTKEFKDLENENSNSNALYLMINEWEKAIARKIIF